MRNKKILIVLWAVLITNLLLWLFASIFLFSVMGPYNPTSLAFLKKDGALIARDFLPEGFAFFTRDPREERPYLYELKDGMIELVTKPNASPSNLFGISRKQRAMHFELGSLITALSDQEWNTCATTFNYCLSMDSVKSYEIRNSTPNPILCGTYYLKSIKPVPWAWRNSFRGEMPHKFVKIKVRCD
ncbi:MAG: SdpA family antimicrobial peptide system protein [Thermoplasmatales archaeon]